MPKNDLPANKKKSRSLFVLRLVLILLIVIVTSAAVIAWPLMQARVVAKDSSLASLPVLELDTPSPTFAPSETPLAPSPAILTTQPPIVIDPIPSLPGDQGLVILAIGESGTTHLFAFQPQQTRLTRLTNGPWHDINPAFSPDGKRLAFASNRDGTWDLYQLSLADGEITRLTADMSYQASPSWSPDGLWLAYEAFSEDTESLDIYIRSVEDPAQTIRLADDRAADHSPAWSPDGRKIAFVSNRSGDNEIWLADLDSVDQRFKNISQRSGASESHPTWSMDGKLVWSSAANGLNDLYVWDSNHPEEGPRFSGNGDYPVWSPNNKALITISSTPNRTYLTGYDVQTQGLALTPLILEGPVRGLTWSNASLPEPVPDFMVQAAQTTPTPLWTPVLNGPADVPGGRLRVVDLGDVEAPHPLLQDLADDSFQALRLRVAAEVGWDFLSTLENAFVPLTAPLPPGMMGDWLYTGRAIAFNPAPMNAGWLVVIREDFGPHTYWRVYLKTRFQDGSKGTLLHERPWDFGARFSGDPRHYEQGGGQVESIPAGYWFDFTELAASYGWQRLPALNSWHASYTASRFNEFIFAEGMDWYAAMLEVYPREALYTPTPIPPPTFTPTNTPWLSRTPTLTSTRWPTYTPTPTKTRYVTRTPLPSNTPTITPTFTPTMHDDLAP